MNSVTLHPLVRLEAAATSASVRLYEAGHIVNARMLNSALVEIQSCVRNALNTTPAIEQSALWWQPLSLVLLPRVAIDRARLARVSTSMRKALYSECSLWTQVAAVLPSMHIDNISVPHPISLRVQTSVHDESAGSQCVHLALLTRYWKHLRTLDLTVWSSDLLRGRALTQTELHTLVLDVRAFSHHFTDRVTEKLYLRYDVLGGNRIHKTLQDLAICDVLLRSGASSGRVYYSAFRGVRRFCYTATWKRLLKESHLRFLIDQMPALEELWMNFHKFQMSGIAEADEDQTKEVRPMNVGRLLPHIKVHATTGSLEPEIYNLWPNSKLRLVFSLNRLRIEGTASNKVSSGTDTDSDTPGSSRQMGTFALHTTTTRITALTLAECEWERLHSLPLLPSLAELSIVLSVCCEPLHNDGTSIFVMRHEPHAFAMPALRRLELCSGARWWPRDDTREGSTMLLCERYHFHGLLTTIQSASEESRDCTIALEDLLSVLRALLGPGQRLPLLVLAGITTLADVEPGLALCEILREVADDVEMTSHPHRELVEDCRQPDPWDVAMLPRWVQRVKDSWEGCELPHPSYDVAPL
ncbi:hypothetical protein BKA62DRAFT_724397 [Auriculariales sp. MPI-PUGE-AT-0066]|nr:hypothetical protein BKA62DRAFT_724397 [Auriculariales sp. MPI-PUGE-AT-0066]